MDDIYKSIEAYNLKKPENINFFDDDMINNKKLNPIVTTLFIRGRKLNISLFLLHNLILLCQKILD